MENPCKRTCKDRNAECHAVCDRYKSFETERMELRKKRNEIARVNSILDNMDYRRTERRAYK